MTFLNIPYWEEDEEGNWTPAVVGRQLVIGFENFNMLKRLELHFDAESEKVELFKPVAATVFLPLLEDLALGRLCCDLDDLSLFLVRHAATLKSCALSGLHPEAADLPGVTQRIRQSLLELRDHLVLESLFYREHAFRELCVQLCWPVLSRFLSTTRRRWLYIRMVWIVRRSLSSVRT